MLGLSHSTVSRALNNNPRISLNTRKIIQEKANQLGYIPNNAARILKNEPSRIIGLVIPDIKNDFYTTIAQTISYTASEESLQLVLSTTDDIPEREYYSILNLLKLRADGVIITLCQNPLPKTLELLKKLTVVQLIRTSDELHSPSVTVNDQLGIYLATKHLLDLGHSEIAYIGTSVKSTGYNRLSGFNSATKDSKVNIPDSFIKIGQPKAYFGEQAFEELFLRSPQRPTAIVVGSERASIGIINMAKRMGIKIPEQVSLVGYGDADWCSIWNDGLTTLSLPENEIASTCIKILLLSIFQNITSEQMNKIYTVDPVLIIRESTRKAAAKCN